jgi:very-short-patch-repair endonuclease
MRASFRQTVDNRTEEDLTRISINLKNSWTDERRNQKSRQSKAFWKNKTEEEKTLAMASALLGSKKYFEDPFNLNRRSESVRNRWIEEKGGLRPRSRVAKPKQIKTSESKRVHYSKASKKSWTDEEYRKKIEEGRRLWFEKARKEGRSLRFNGTRYTDIEMIVMNVLNELGIVYLDQEYVAGYYPDFLIPSKNLILECDGFRWHGTPEAKARDTKRDAKLTALGYKVIRLTDTQIKQDAHSAVTSALRLVA